MTEVFAGRVGFLISKDSRAFLRQRIKDIASSRPRFGYLRIHTLLRREGVMVNKKLVYRLYTEEGLQVRTKRRKKYAARTRSDCPEATEQDQIWSMAFVADKLV